MFLGDVDIGRYFEKYFHLGSSYYNVKIRSIKFSCYISLHMVVVQREYLKIHAGNTILSHYLIEVFPTYSCIVISLDCVSQQSTINTTFNLLSHPWHEIMVIPSNIGLDRIFRMLELQTRVVLKNQDTSDSSFQYPSN